MKIQSHYIVVAKLIERLGKLIPHILPVEEIPLLVDEWRALQAEKLMKPGLRKNVLERKKVKLQQK